MKGFQRLPMRMRASPTTAGSQTAAVSRREEEFVYLDYFMYGVFVELYGVRAGWGGLTLDGSHERVPKICRWA